jgi:hypothetical protein
VGCLLLPLHAQLVGCKKPTLRSSISGKIYDMSKEMLSTAFMQLSGTRFAARGIGAGLALLAIAL